MTEGQKNNFLFLVGNGINLVLNGSGIRDTARVLGVGINTVIRELKKRSEHSNSKCPITQL
tara:strand:- start:667 stop:849 length:183 start_codon:yes stop_codon:yes gene_type:complete